MAPAPISIGSGARLPVRKNAMAIPGSTAWLMASPSIAIFRNTRNEPTNAQAPAANEPVRIIQNALKSMIEKSEE